MMAGNPGPESHRGRGGKCRRSWQGPRSGRAVQSRIRTGPLGHAMPPLTSQTPQIPSTMKALVKREAAKGIWMEEVPVPQPGPNRSEEHTSELQSLMRISYAVFCLKKKNTTTAD